MTEIHTIKLTSKELDQLINMVNAASFKGEHAREVMQLLEHLKEGLKHEKIDSENTN